MNKQLLIIKALQSTRDQFAAKLAARIAGVGGDELYFAFTCNSIKSNVKKLAEGSGGYDELQDEALDYIKPYAPLNISGETKQLRIGDAWYPTNKAGLRIRIAMLDLAIEDAINASVP